MIENRTKRLLDVRLASDQASQRLPSVAAGITRDGELLWSGGRGLVDGQPPDASTQYRAGSITKTFVAAAVLMLRDAGRLSLSDPIGTYLDDDSVGAIGSMTVGQLLSHAAGLRAETAGPWWERTPGTSLADLATSSLGAEAARFRPGRRFHYSNVGFALLGALLTAEHGVPWYDVIARELLGPLGMKRTTTRPERPHAAGYAVHPYADALLAEPEHDAGAMAPAGQLWTTVGDLATFARFLSGGAPDLLAEATLAEMREPIVIGDAPEQPWAAAYGMGLQLWNTAGQRYYGHTGSMPGFVAIMQIADGPGADTAIVMCNSTTGFSYALGTDLLGILSECEPYSPAEWKPAIVDQGLLDMLGSWFWGPAAFTLRLDGNELELRMAGGDGRGMRFRPTGRGGGTGIDGYQAGEPLVPVTGPDGSVIALNIGSFIYTRTPYDPAAPVPGGIDPAGWRAAPAAGQSG
ncbi:MAG: beta-lactamase family protein [Nocardiopsaceae bacterium]|jgi:CubicO group peptidase (beta-lactamase class C family)|nr:beta-lactamase family protein [Nocardiopsaceae bacterium]